MATKQTRQTPAPEPAAAEYVAPDGTRYRIGTLTQGKKTYWRTERLTDGTWEAANTSIYPRYEDAKGEFAAWSRREALVPAEAALPAFDYSGLDAQTAEMLHNLARRALESRQRYVLDMMEIVFEAHRELCGTVVAPCDNGGVVQPLDNSNRGNRGEAAFRTWCASIGVSKSTAYNLLQVQALMDDSTPEEQEILEAAPAKLLYAAAKPSAPPEAVAAVKSGAVTTHRQYQGLLEEIRQRDAKIDELTGQTEKLERALDDVSAEKHAAQEKLAAAEKDMKNQHDAAKNMLRKLKNENEQLRGENEALRAQPVPVAVEKPDPAEIDRLAGEKAREMTAGLQAQLDEQVQKNLEQTRRAWEVESADFDMVAFAAQTIENAWQQAAPAWARMEQGVRSTLRGNLEDAVRGVNRALEEFTEEGEHGGM